VFRIAAFYGSRYQGSGVSEELRRSPVNRLPARKARRRYRIKRRRVIGVMCVSYKVEGLLTIEK
jgi:hypothetical protein